MDIVTYDSQRGGREAFGHSNDLPEQLLGVNLGRSLQKSRKHTLTHCKKSAGGPNPDSVGVILEIFSATFITSMAA